MSPLFSKTVQSALFCAGAFGLSFLSGCGLLDSGRRQDDLDGQSMSGRTVIASRQSAITTPAGMATYCSVSYPGGGWAFSWEGSDPCNAILSKKPGGTIVRASIFSAIGTSNVVMRCGGVVGLWRGFGVAPLVSALDNATANSRTSCVFTAAPQDLPIFNSPYSTSSPPSGLSYGTGFDFAQFNQTLEVTSFGQVGFTTATIVDHLGRDKSASGAINGHAGHDWPMALNTPRYAVTDGQVVAARARDVSSFGCGVGSDPGTTRPCKREIRSAFQDLPDAPPHRTCTSE